MKDDFGYDANCAPIEAIVKDIWQEFNEILAEYEIEELARRKLDDFEEFSNYMGE